ncbi:hypothetical protein ACSQ67_008033 [Phaseolus vulgaris]
MEGARRLQGQSIGLFNEGIGLLLFRWSALRTAVENEWGGRESRVKADQLVTDVLSWFTQSKEDILDQGMLSLNVEVEDGSVEEVAEKLMVMHEEFLDENFSSFENLRKANLEQAARPPHTPQNREIPRTDSNSNSVNEPRPNVSSEADDGWVVVSNKRNKGRKN